ncbi:hypothetical protein Pla111_14530 [Botrimarina hoheduenensis]|uniref:DUF2971 domain-containing protein n=1 Tax=Botrimarina hoheduenensis TaxID=2528000 RepID=A0A5C5WAA2_9BACT|nr:hypothetical protein Pla111_14530 [Botrimarina hoheduenensis]
MELIKFRSLGDCNSLLRAKDIIGKNLFWCSRIWEMNDPMEGVYKCYPNSNAISKLYNAKKKRFICSCSDTAALSTPSMWGYYANGFRGIALKFTSNSRQLNKIQYCDELPTIEYWPAVENLIHAL